MRIINPLQVALISTALLTLSPNVYALSNHDKKCKAGEWTILPCKKSTVNIDIDKSNKFDFGGIDLGGVTIGEINFGKGKDGESFGSFGDSIPVLGPDEYFQDNRGNIVGATASLNSRLREKGTVKLDTTALANNFSAEVDANIKVDKVTQINSGNVVAVTLSHKNFRSAGKKIKIDSTALANNASITVGDNNSLAGGFHQGNSGNVIAGTVHLDPVLGGGFLARRGLNTIISTTALGNNLSIGGLEKFE